MNFHVIVNNDGFFQFSSGGYPGHATDAASYARMPSIGFRQHLHLPQNTTLQPILWLRHLEDQDVVV